MRSFIAESGVEEVCLDYFADLGWSVIYGPEIAPGEVLAERSSYRETLLSERLRSAVTLLNPSLDMASIAEVVATIRRAESADVLAENWRIYKLLITGVPFQNRLSDGESRHDLAQIVDFEHPERNEFLAINQYTVEGDHTVRRPDVVLFVNGLPLGLLELKVPGEERATLRGAYDQLRTYAAEIPALLAYNAVCVISTGTQARMGPLAGRFEHYAPWKTIDGKRLV
jgi:type I restriction enzyme R subunit